LLSLNGVKEISRTLQAIAATEIRRDFLGSCRYPALEAVSVSASGLFPVS
jgi:hypothetical protein